MSQRSYYTLLTSLPHIDSLFSSKMPPISRFQLDKRLSMLTVGDQQKLMAIETLLHWDCMIDEDDIDESSLPLQAERVKAHLDDRPLIDLINWHLDVHTIIAALRYRHAGHPPPSEARWSYGTRYPYIRSHWTSPTLGLGSTFPWIPRVNECLHNGHCLALDKILLQSTWDYLTYQSTPYQNSFCAVVIYVMRWHLVARWTRYDSAQALTRFQAIAEKSLDRFREQFSACAA